jgi:hypothetical protein
MPATLNIGIESPPEGATTEQALDWYRQMADMNMTAAAAAALAARQYLRKMHELQARAEPEPLQRIRTLQ